MLLKIFLKFWRAIGVFGRVVTGLFLLVIVLWAGVVVIAHYIERESKSLEVVEFQMSAEESVPKLRIPQAYIESIKSCPNPKCRKNHNFGEIRLRMAWPDLRPWTLRHSDFVDPMSGEKIEALKESVIRKFTVIIGYSPESRFFGHRLDTHPSSANLRTSLQKKDAKYGKLDQFVYDLSVLTDRERKDRSFYLDYFAWPDESGKYKAVIRCGPHFRGGTRPNCNVYTDIEGGGLHYRYHRELFPIWEEVDRRVRQKLATFGIK